MTREIKRYIGRREGGEEKKREKRDTVSFAFKEFLREN